MVKYTTMTKTKWVIALITIILAFAGLGFAAMSTSPPFTVPTWIPVMCFILAGIGVLVLICFLTWPLIKRLRFYKPIGFAKSEEGSPNINQSEGKLPLGIEFFETRPSFSDFRARLESTTVIWAAWQVGGTVSQHNIFDAGNFERLVLLNPDGKTVEAIAKSMGKDLVQLTNSIRGLIKDALKHGIAPRLYDGLSYSLITIGDPRADNGWALLEPFLVGIEADQRCGFIVNKKDHPDLFKKVCDSFIAIWKACLPYTNV